MPTFESPVRKYSPEELSSIRKVLSFPNILIDDSFQNYSADPMVTAINRLAEAIEKYNSICILRDLKLLTEMAKIEEVRGRR